MVSPAARAIANGLPEEVAAAVLEFITGDLLREPRRVGKPLQRELGGRWGGTPGQLSGAVCHRRAGWGVTVLAAEHRRDVYRRR